MPIAEVLLKTKARKIGTTITGAATIVGALFAIPPAWSALELPEIATRLYVKLQVDPMKLAQADTTKAIFQLQLQQLQSSLYAAKLDQQKAPSQTVDQRVQELEDQIRQTQAKIK